MQLCGRLIVGETLLLSFCFHQAEAVHKGWSAGNHLEPCSDGAGQQQKALNLALRGSRIINVVLPNGGEVNLCGVVL